ncbi:hypothetical protein GCM10009740_12070 [Terrabacter terrae]|uniref:Gfo/Idh/MocA-like oxidoreductase N-terminal domain-containing protein n=1 Tax=Terrabacter terrae TaxID=318434 RepID=A0ABN2TXG1_9MICO
MRAAVVGTGWGLVHVRALRENDVDVVALCGSPRDAERTRAVAAQERIPLALNDPRDIHDLDVDVVTVATPAHTHLDMLELFAGSAVICEKPVAGATGDLARVPSATSSTFVNYAFSFLDCARVFARALESAGPPDHVFIDTAYDLPLTFTAPEWFLEVASHPLSLLVHLLGPPAVVGGSTRPDPHDATELQLRIGEVDTQVASRHEPGLHGLRHRIRAHGPAGTLELTGGFQEGRSWRFAPVRLDGRALDAGEWSPHDVWHRANQRSIGAALQVFRGELAPEEAGAAGLFTPSRAAVIDHCLQQALGRPLGTSSREDR